MMNDDDGGGGGEQATQAADDDDDNSSTVSGDSDTDNEQNDLEEPTSTDGDPQMITYGSHRAHGGAGEQSVAVKQGTQEEHRHNRAIRAEMRRRLESVIGASTGNRMEYIHHCEKSILESIHKLTADWEQHAFAPPEKVVVPPPPTATPGHAPPSRLRVTDALFHDTSGPYAFPTEPTPRMNRPIELRQIDSVANEDLFEEFLRDLAAGDRVYVNRTYNTPSWVSLMPADVPVIVLHTYDGAAFIRAWRERHDLMQRYRWMIRFKVADEAHSVLQPGLVRPLEERLAQIATLAAIVAEQWVGGAAGVSQVDYVNAALSVHFTPIMAYLGDKKSDMHTNAVYAPRVIRAVQQAGLTRLTYAFARLPGPRCASARRLEKHHVHSLLGASGPSEATAPTEEVALKFALLQTFFLPAALQQDGFALVSCVDRELFAIVDSVARHFGWDATRLRCGACLSAEDVTLVVKHGRTLPPSDGHSFHATPMERHRSGMTCCLCCATADVSDRRKTRCVNDCLACPATAEQW